MDVLSLIAVIAIYACVVVGLGVVIMLVKDRMDESSARRWELRHPEQILGTPEYKARLHAPNFEAVESRVHRQLPTALTDLYSNRELLGETDFVLVPPSATSFDDTWVISCFHPVDYCLDDFDWGPEGLRPDDIIIASDGGGGMYYVPLAAVQQDICPVMHYHHDGDDRTLVADSLTDFFSWRRADEQEIDDWQLQDR